jgi:hypothetical protein
MCEPKELLPAEPRPGSVVLNRQDIAWQRSGNLWYVAHGDASLDWEELCRVHGPLRLLWVRPDYGSGESTTRP